MKVNSSGGDSLYPIGDKEGQRELAPVKTDRDRDVKSKEDNLDPVYSKDEIIKTIEKANDEFVAYDRRFEFSIHEKTKQITIKIFDTITNEVIREVPPEKILDMIAGIWEAAGIIVDEKI